MSISCLIPTSFLPWHSVSFHSLPNEHTYRTSGDSRYDLISVLLVGHLPRSGPYRRFQITRQGGHSGTLFPCKWLPMRDRHLKLLSCVLKVHKKLHVHCQSYVLQSNIFPGVWWEIYNCYLLKKFWTSGVQRILKYCKDFPLGLFPRPFFLPFACSRPRSQE